MRHYYFIESETGEEFIVGADTLEEAWMIAEDVGNQITADYAVRVDLEFLYEMTDEEAEMSGLDEY
jgi:hypothetical protein